MLSFNVALDEPGCSCRCRSVLPCIRPRLSRAKPDFDMAQWTEMVRYHLNSTQTGADHSHRVYRIFSCAVMLAFGVHPPAVMTELGSWNLGAQL